MIFKTEQGKTIDLNRGTDLSIPLSNDSKNPLAWQMNPPEFEPVKGDGWIGLVKEGAAVNFRNLFFNPHAHGTHTECLGHITNEVYSINQQLNQFFYNAVVISVEPEKKDGDSIITQKLFKSLQRFSSIEALIVRTLPNSERKKSRVYSGTNPPYFELSCLELFNKLNVKHLLIDLPSVDKEDDGGKVAFHHGFWNVPQNPRFDRTITELIYVPNSIKDGEYILNLQVAAFENDAAPSRPVIYTLV